MEKKKRFCGSLNLKGNTAFLEAVFVEMLYQQQDDQVSESCIINKWFNWIYHGYVKTYLNF